MNRLPRPLSELGLSRVRLSLRLLVLASKSDPGLLIDPDWQQCVTSAQVVMNKGAAGSAPAELLEELRRIEVAIV